MDYHDDYRNLVLNQAGTSATWMVRLVSQSGDIRSQVVTCPRIGVFFKKFKGLYAETHAWFTDYRVTENDIYIYTHLSVMVVFYHHLPIWGVP